VTLEGDDIRVSTAIFGGTSIVTTAFRSDGPHLANFRPKSFEASEGGGTSATVEQVSASQQGSAKVLERHVEEHEGPILDEANLVVSGGRGLGSAENYQMVEDLAKKLRGAPGASRAIVDAGWVPYSYQVGQTGKVVKPDVYIALGISGATQHMVGMKGSKNIVAVNKDPEAPIFSIADLGIVGDVHKVVPKLLEALQG
jgi:electron transfer flavoprotein alpha subunit